MSHNTVSQSKADFFRSIFEPRKPKPIVAKKGDWVIVFTPLTPLINYINNVTGVKNPQFFLAEAMDVNEDSVLIRKLGDNISQVYYVSPENAHNITTKY